QSFRLTNAGVYQIVSREDGADATGPYELTLVHTQGHNLAHHAHTNRIVAGQTISGTTSQADLDAYEYTSGGNEWITIATARTDVGSGFFDPVFDLMAPDALSLHDALPILQSFRLTNAGVYQIVSREDGADATGPYELTLV